jgi:hypothetical protein
MRLRCRFLLSLLNSSCINLQEGHLRAASTNDNEQRDLLKLDSASSSNSLAFSFASSAGAKDLCVDYVNECLEKGKVFTLANTTADADGNSLATAVSEANLWLEAYCTANAEAYARACAFTHAKGKVTVDVTTAGGMKTVSLRIKLEAASTSYAFANTSAVADSYAAVEAQSFTDVRAYCNSVSNMSPLCTQGRARTDLDVVANASALAFSDAVSEAGSEGFGKARASVFVEGTSINTVSSHLMAMAKAWAFSSVNASASAFASVATKIIDESFARVCDSKHRQICAKKTGNYGKGVCKTGPIRACASARAYGEANGNALASSLAQVFLDANAKSSTIAILRADVDLKSTPKLKWTTTRGGSEVSCPKK